MTFYFLKDKESFFGVDFFIFSSLGSKVRQVTLKYTTVDVAQERRSQFMNNLPALKKNCLYFNLGETFISV